MNAFAVTHKLRTCSTHVEGSVQTSDNNEDGDGDRHVFLKFANILYFCMRNTAQGPTGLRKPWGTLLHTYYCSRPSLCPPPHRPLCGPFYQPLETFLLWLTSWRNTSLKNCWKKNPYHNNYQYRLTLHTSPTTFQLHQWSVLSCWWRPWEERRTLP